MSTLSFDYYIKSKNGGSRRLVRIPDTSELRLETNFTLIPYVKVGPVRLYFLSRKKAISFYNALRENLLSATVVVITFKGFYFPVDVRYTIGGYEDRYTGREVPEREICCWPTTDGTPGG